MICPNRWVPTPPTSSDELLSACAVYQQMRKLHHNFGNQQYVKIYPKSEEDLKSCLDFSVTIISDADGERWNGYDCGGMPLDEATSSMISNSSSVRYCSSFLSAPFLLPFQLYFSIAMLISY